jgi:hypothetical protein
MKKSCPECKRRMSKIEGTVKVCLPQSFLY